MGVGLAGTPPGFNNHDIFVFTASSILFLSWFYFLRSFSDKSERANAWILTLMCGSVCGYSCWPTVAEAISQGHFKTETLYSNNPTHRLIILFFVAYLFWDSILMFKYFPSQGGLYHHVPFFFVMTATLYYGCPGVFVVFMVVEWPTVILSLIKIWPSLRKWLNIVFGIMWVSCRILYHAWLSYQLYLTRSDCPLSFVWFLSCCPWPLHIVWFLQWLRNTLKHSKEERRGGNHNHKIKDNKAGGHNADTDMAMETNSKQEMQKKFT